MLFSTCSISPSFCFPFPQLENIGNFVRAITEYGLKPHDLFEANDLFENVNHTQVQSTLIALAGMVRAAAHTHMRALTTHSYSGAIYCREEVDIVVLLPTEWH